GGQHPVGLYTQLLDNIGDLLGCDLPHPGPPFLQKEPSGPARARKGSMLSIVLFLLAPAGIAPAELVARPFQVGHLLVAGLLEAGHHVFEAAAVVAAALPLKVTGPALAGLGHGTGRPGLPLPVPAAAALLAALGPALLVLGKRLLDGQADLPLLADGQHLHLYGLPLGDEVLDLVD